MSTDHIAGLAKTAEETARRIFASLPYMERFAHTMTILAMANTAAWGKAIVMAMIKAGIHGMDDIDGQPAAEWAKKVGYKPERLPAGYMNADKLGAAAYREALMKIGDPHSAAEFMQEIVLGFWSGAFKLEAGRDVHEAKRYFFQVLKTRLISRRRDNLKHRKDVYVDDTDDSDEGHYHPTLLKSEYDFEDLVDDAHMHSAVKDVMHHPDVVNGLKSIHPDAPLFIELLMDGYSQKKIIEDHMLPHYEGSIQNWHKKKEKMFDFLEHKFKEYAPKLQHLHHGV